LPHVRIFPEPLKFRSLRDRKRLRRFTRPSAQRGARASCLAWGAAGSRAFGTDHREPKWVALPPALPRQLAPARSNTMIRFNKSTVLFLAIALGIWGCARSNPPENKEAARIRT